MWDISAERKVSFSPSSTEREECAPLRSLFFDKNIATMMSPEDFASELESTRKCFATNRTKDIQWRRRQLKAFLDMFTGANADLWCEALRRDLGKPRQEAMTMEVEYNANVCRTALRHLDEWAADENTVKSTLTLLDGTFIRREPHGVCLVLGAWNYPAQLTFAPVVGALAAGNAVFIKPSELAPSVAELARKLVAAHMDRDLVKVVEGGVEETTKLLRLRFDYIFFTGSTRVGRIVGESAARHLTPCTLELGGKSPLYLDASVDWERAVKRIVWGKMVNLGQTCVAPDYVLCSKATQEKLVSYIREIYPKFYGRDAKSSEDLCRIVNDRNFERLSKLLADTKGKISFGGTSDASDRFMDLTVVTDVGVGDSLMSEELFGPILPIVNAESLDDAIKYINSGEKPLSLYIFSLDKKVQQRIISETSSGSVCCNDVMVQLSVESLPFGGVGQSGHGRYHGKYTYDTFSHLKSVLRRDYNIIGEALGAPRFPPYSEGKTRWLNALLKSRPMPSANIFAYLVCVLIGGAATLLWQKYQADMHF